MEGVFDKVAIIGAGCCKFGENFDQSRYDMIVDATFEALEDAGLELKDIQAAWVSTQHEMGGASIVSDALKLNNIPISRCENFCSSGLDTFRNACFAIAAGMYDRVLVVGFEKVKDLATRGLPTPPLGWGGHPILFADAPPLSFAMAATKYFERHGIDRVPLAKVAVKNHHNGSLTPKAHLQREITLEQVLNAPLVAWPLGLFDCCGVSDGAAAAIITKKEIAKSFREDYITVRGIGLSVSIGRPMERPDYDYSGFTETEVAAMQAYEQAGITNPRRGIDCAEVHDCFSITEILNYEDLHFCERGQGWRFIEDGISTLEGELPVNMDGGLKCFGHPVGATGLRMVYEVYKQLQGKCGPRQVRNAEIGLAHTLGGVPRNSCVVILSN
jgi:acetyl-CoA C-acetyltransferase